MVALVRCNVSDMSQNENDNNQTDYVCTFFMDSKVQEKLLEVDESFLWEDCLQCNATNTNNSAKQDKSFKFDIRCAELTGWCNKSRVNFRKAEKDSKPHPKDLTKLETREDYFGYHYKETRPKRPESFKFRHFSDIKKYILQYRSDHACSSSSTVKTPPSLYMEPDIKRAFHSRLSAHTPSINGKVNRLPDATQTHINGVPTNACLHYTTRKDTKPALHELAYKYKLAPNIVLLNENNSNSPEHEKVTLQMRSHSASAKSPRIYSGKLPQSKLSSKMPAPFGQSHVNSKPPSLQTLTVSGHSSPKPGDMAAMRTVDQLSCITTGDRQEDKDPDDKLQRRLELLRTINKPSTRDKQKLTKLMFLRDDGSPVSVDEMSQKLCDQRRLKHFLEQAKLKNFKPTTSFFTLPTKSSLQHNLAKTSSFHRSGVIQDVTSPRSSISSISDCDVSNIQTTDMSNHAPYQDVCEEDSEWKKFTQNAPVQLITHAD